MAKTSDGFFAELKDLNEEDYVLLDYSFECEGDPEEVAAHLCQEQSTAQWKRVGVEEDLRTVYGAKVVDLQVIKILDQPSYPARGSQGGKTHLCHVKIAHPHRNFGPRIPNLLTAVLGEGAFYSPGISVIKLLDITFPASYLSCFEGPKFGVEGLRKQLQVFDRPLFLGVIKPNIGLPPEPFAELAYQGMLGGLDIAKDDELLADAPWSTLAERSQRIGKARRKAEEITGEKKIYLANITDEVDRLLELHDLAVKNGANAVMVNGMTTGLSAVRMLRKHTQVPLFAHFDLFAACTDIGFFGVHSRVFTKLQRMVGFDCIIFPGFGKRMKTPDEEVLDNVQTCLAPMGDLLPCLPVPAGSQWAGSTSKLYERLGTIDFGIVPGRAVFEHPMGPEAGAKSLRQGWEASVANETLEAYAQNRPELKAAIDAFAE